MKLLLTSGGLTNQTIITALSELVVKPFTELNLTAIVTASFVEPTDKSWVINHLYQFQKLNFNYFDILDISNIPAELWLPRLNKADIILVEGGNTHHLMYWVNKSGFGTELHKMLNDKIYVGISAGSIITTPNFALSQQDKTNTLSLLGEDATDEGLSLVPFLIKPHINSPKHPERTFSEVEKMSEPISYPVYALDDNSAIKVVDNDVAVVSEGSWKRFN